LAFEAMSRLRKRHHRPPSFLLVVALFSRRHRSPGYLYVATVSSCAGGCMRLRHPYRQRPHLGNYEMPSCLVATLHLKQSEQCPLLGGGLLDLAVI
jgi:hypothetical protein